MAGRIVILNGAPRSGKTSIARAIQRRLDGVWMNLGVDVYRQAVPDWLQPAIGLRPGGERRDIERHLPLLFAGLYESIAAQSRVGLDVVVDIGHHDAHSEPLHILQHSARRLVGLPVLVVGVRCPLPAILARRAAAEAGREGVYDRAGTDGGIPASILAWQTQVHDPGIYDVEVDTGSMSPDACCSKIREGLATWDHTTSAIRRIARMG